MSDRFYFNENADCLEDEYIEDKMEETFYRHDELDAITGLLNRVHDSFVREYEEVEELTKEIKALCDYAYKIEGYVEANAEDIWDLREAYGVDKIMGD